MKTTELLGKHLTVEVVLKNHEVGADLLLRSLHNMSDIADAIQINSISPNGNLINEVLAARMLVGDAIDRIHANPQHMQVELMGLKHMLSGMLMSTDVNIPKLSILKLMSLCNITDVSTTDYGYKLIESDLVQFRLRRNYTVDDSDSIIVMIDNVIYSLTAYVDNNLAMHLCDDLIDKALTHEK